MRMGCNISSVVVVGWLSLSGFSVAQASPQSRPQTNAQTSPQGKKADSNRGLDLNSVPFPVIEGAQKAVPNFAFTTVEKQSSWRRGQYYRIWGMDSQQRQIYLEVNAAGKVIERPKVIKEKDNQTKETQANVSQAGVSQTNLIQTKDSNLKDTPAKDAQAKENQAKYKQAK
jgi:hypothetical protein